MVKFKAAIRNFHLLSRYKKNILLKQLI